MDIIVKTFEGLEDVLIAEMEALGFKNIKKLRRAVFFEGELEDLYKANLYLRTGLRVLVPVYQFDARNERDFYNKMKRHPWGKYLKLFQTFAINSVVRSKTFTHSQYMGLKMKDAIVDQFRERNSNRRPNVDRDDPDVRFSLHIHENKCTVSIDSSGESLHKRGFRLPGHQAPLNEVLAAGMVLMTGYKGKQQMLDPMCGTGTLAIEAAMVAMNQAPNLNRKEFGFMKWIDYDSFLWNKIVAEAKKKITPIEVPILASDASYKAISAANDAVRMAGLEGAVVLSAKEFEDLAPPSDEGMLLFNPPYGKRIELEDVEEFYGDMGTFIKHHFAGFDAWILMGNLESLKYIGLHASKKIPLYNGPLECRFCLYELFKGKRKDNLENKSIEEEE